MLLITACSSGSGSAGPDDASNGENGLNESAMVGPDIQTIDQGNAPSGIACFAMLFAFYQDQGMYRDAFSGAAVTLGQPAGGSIADDSPLWNWINAGSGTVTLQQLAEAAYRLNDYTGNRAHYFVKLQADTTQLSAVQSRREELAYIAQHFLKRNRPVIIQMRPANTLFSAAFHVVLLGYDAGAQTVTYACPRDGGYKATASVSDFLGGYCYKPGTLQQARWDGAWLGFFQGAAPAGDHRFSFELEGYTRSYLMHVPEGYTGAAPVPLVLDFHGLYMNAAVESRTSGFKALSESEGFIVVYPEGTAPAGLSAQNWNADTTGLQWYSWANLSAVDDVEFALAVVADVKRQLAIDAGRVYLSGLSQGGSMALLCAHDCGDVFAAAAVVSTALMKHLKDYAPLRPIPVASFHSYEDATVPYAGNILSALPPIEDTARQWAIVNGCDYDHPGVSILGYPDAQHPDVPEKLTTYTGGAEVRLYSLHGSSENGDPHVLYKNNFHGQTVEEKELYLARLAWDFLKRFRI